MALEDKRRWTFLRYGGAVGFGEDVVASVLPAHLAACLRNVGAWNVIVDGDSLRFTGSAIGAPFGPMRNALAPFGCGELDVDPKVREVRYHLRLVPLIALATASVCCLGLLLLAVHVPVVGIGLALPIVWTLIVGSNLAFGVVVFTGFLRRSISSAPKGEQATDARSSVGFRVRPFDNH